MRFSHFFHFNTMTYLIPVIFFILCLTTGCATIVQTDSSEPEKKVEDSAGTCVSGDCQNGEGVWKYDDGRRYEGSFIAGRPGGEGVIYLVSGSEYDGQFKYGLYDGGGNVLFGDGSGAECERGNCINGRGVILFEDGSRYSGGFKDEMRTGYGGLEMEDGSTYSSDFINNLFDGKGTLVLADKTEYSGWFLAGKMQGTINVRFPTNHKFVGLFENDHVVEDQGRLIFPNNTRGNCVDGNCITGNGTLVMDDGAKYQGGFLRCSRHGQGKQIFASGSVYEGEFQHGKRHGYGTFIFASGIKFEGRFWKGERHGRGTISFPDGTTQNVLYRNGKLIERKF
ncbi:MAG: hypothetical protein K9K37_07190 [Desulfocapsa sp.]|nr:hypothetical protein [Desulfocapsa sp.]